MTLKCVHAGARKCEEYLQSMSSSAIMKMSHLGHLMFESCSSPCTAPSDPRTVLPWVASKVCLLQDPNMSMSHFLERLLCQHFLVSKYRCCDCQFMFYFSLVGKENALSDVRDFLHTKILAGTTPDQKQLCCPFAHVFSVVNLCLAYDIYSLF